MGVNTESAQSRWPAGLDVLQSASGLLLVLFMWGHMAFVSTILISKDAMWWVTKMFEGQFVFGQTYSAVVSVIVVLVSTLFVLFGFLTMRNLPGIFQVKIFANGSATTALCSVACRSLAAGTYVRNICRSLCKSQFSDANGSGGMEIT
jgi:succinate dehydrogenase/fumarate reductase cytochrome b subunit